MGNFFGLGVSLVEVVARPENAEPFDVKGTRSLLEGYVVHTRTPQKVRWVPCYLVEVACDRCDRWVMWE